MKQYFFIIFLLISFCLLSLAHSEITTDGSLGPKTNLKGPNFHIQNTLGQQKGGNLFHSFEKFNIRSGENAVFTGPETVDNIIGRVTGQSNSLINGGLFSTIPGANLFLLNPLGFIFGPNASLNIDGSFFVSSADYLSLGQDGRFDAKVPENSVLTMSHPSAFGFLDNSPGSISFENTRPGMIVRKGNTLTIAGGEVNIKNSMIAAQNGKIYIVSAASPGQAKISGSKIDDSSFEQYGDITVSEGSTLYTGPDGSSSGGIFIRSSRFIVKDEKTLVVSENIDNPGSDIDISLQKEVVVTDHGQILTISQADGDAGDIRIKTENLNVSDNGKINSIAVSTGNSGELQISANSKINISADSQITSKSEKNGQAGNLEIAAKDIEISDGGFISSQNTGGGNSGEISINISNSLTISGKNSFNSGIYTEASKTGDSGNITLNSGSLKMSDDSIITTSIYENGNAGDIEIKTGSINMETGSEIDTFSKGMGNSGDILINANDSFEISGYGSEDNGTGLYANSYIDGDSGDISIKTDTLKLSDNGIITSGTFGKGNSGLIDLQAENLELSGGGRIVSNTSGSGSGGNISADIQKNILISGTGEFGESGIYNTASTDSSGDAGNITVSAANLTINDNAVISGETGGSGKGSDVKINADTLTIASGGSIKTTGKGTGFSGNILISVKDSAVISGKGDLRGGGLIANTIAGCTGDSGDITISAHSLDINSGGVIASQVFGSGHGGNITADVNRLNITDFGYVVANAGKSAKSGGEISITASDSVQISDSGEISSMTEGPGNAGSIKVKTGILTLTEEGVINSGTQGSGNSGDIFINTDNVDIAKSFISSSSEETASNHSGDSGDIVIHAKESVCISGSGTHDDGSLAEYYGVYVQAQGETGTGGNVEISTNELKIDKDGWVNGQTYGSGHGGNIKIDADRIEIHQGGTLSTSTRGTGNSGDITINAKESLNISGAGVKQDKSWIYTATHSAGHGGTITITTPALNVGEQGSVYADTLGDDTQDGNTAEPGQAGNIILETDHLKLTKGGSISAGTKTSGKGGDIFIKAKDEIYISGAESENSGIYAISNGLGNSGNITISTAPLTLTAKGQINTSASSSGSGGDINLTITRLEFSDNASITAKSTGTGKSGNISVKASELINNDKGIISTESDMSQGGNITISTPVLSGSNTGIISASVLGGSKEGGSIEVNAANLDLAGGSRIESSTKGQGKGGIVTINASDNIYLSGKKDEISTGVFSTADNKGDAGQIFIKTPVVNLDDTARISTSSSGSGKAGDIILTHDLKKLFIKENAAISSSNTGIGDAGSIDINAVESITVESGSVTTESSKGKGGHIGITAQNLSASNKSLISASVLGGSKEGGSIEVNAANLDLAGGSRIESSTRGQGKGGIVTINASDNIYLSGKKDEISTGVFSTADNKGDAGQIFIKTPVVNLDDTARISTSSSGSGKAGDIILTHDLKKLFIKENAAISSSNTGIGDAGSIDINAVESITVESGSVTTESSKGKGGHIGITAQNLSASNKSLISASVLGGSKEGGSIEVNAANLDLAGGSRIESSTRGQGKGGIVTINASDTIYLSGKKDEISTGVFSTADNKGDAGQIFIKTPVVNLDDTARISTSSSGSGKAGDIILTHDLKKLFIKENAAISSSNTGIGDAGSIDINAVESITVESGSVTTESSKGKGGHIGITAQNLSASNKSLISASVLGGSKEGGSIEVNAANLDLAGSSRIESSTKGEGQGGKIVIKTAQFKLDEKSLISATSINTGNAGDIFINAADGIQMQKSAVTTETINADGGNISLSSKNRTQLNESDITATVGGGKGNGGNIDMDYSLAILEKSRIIAKAHKGKGGNIHLLGDTLIRSGNSVIDASSNLGIDGNIQRDSPETDIGAGIAVLPVNFFNADRWLKTPCSKRSGDDISRFVSAPRDGVPTAFDDWLAAPLSEYEFLNPSCKTSAKLLQFYNKGYFKDIVQALEKGLYHKPVLMAESYQSLGFYQKALSILHNALSSEKNGEIHKALILSCLGDVYLCLGRIEQAKEYLGKALKIETAKDNPAAMAGIFNNMGNILAVDRNETGALAAYEQSLGFIEQASESKTPVKLLKSTVLINSARLKYYSSDKSDDIIIFLNNALEQLSNLSASYQKTVNLISISQLVRKIGKKALSENILSEIAKSSLIKAEKSAVKLKNPRLTSSIFGYMGQLHEEEKKYQQAIQSTKKAIFYAQQGHNPEILYLWYWQLGRLYKSGKDFQKAIDTYNNALSILTPIRSEFFSGYRRKDSIFYEKVKPVYLGYAELLLQQAQGLKDINSVEQILRQSQDVIEILKASELHDFFQDECLTAMQKKNVSLDKLDEHTAIIYPISFNENLVLLISIGGKMKQIKIPVSSEKIDNHIRRLLRLLGKEAGMKQGERDNRSRYYAKKLYDCLILPIEKKLSRSGINTLVFAPDGRLRLIPYAALYDGSQYLIEKYAIAIVPALALTDPNPIKTEIVQTLISGLSESRQGFPSLVNVLEEVRSVKAIIGGKVLQNRDFTSDNLSNELKNNEYSIIHMATHGQFGSTPDKTFLLAYDDKISIDGLENIIGIGRFRDKPIELLTLSACQTAFGDERAALGLAGIAYKAGARSSVATLWYVDDRAGSKLIREFYSQLKKLGISKAKALQNAQKSMIAIPQYQHPIFWSPFILIGNWL